VPSFFSLALDLRVDITTTSEIHADYPVHSLASNIKLPLKPDPAPLLALAITNTLNPPLDLQRNHVLTEPVLVDLGTYINLPSRTNNQTTSPNLSKTRTKIGTVSSDIKGKNNTPSKG
jgi:hypothetical protein